MPSQNTSSLSPNHKKRQRAPETEPAQLANLGNTASAQKKRLRKSQSEPAHHYNLRFNEQRKQREAAQHVRETTIDALPDDLLISIMVALSTTATSPSDLVNAMLVSKRFYVAGTNPHVLAKAGVSALAVKASAWCEGAQRFLNRCVAAGNVEACYTLGMIRFYCLKDICGGGDLIVKAALSHHAAALYALAVIRFNGSNGINKLQAAGARLTAMAAFFGHVDAMREYGLCLLSGYGVKKDVMVGRRLLVKANAMEAGAALDVHPSTFMARVGKNRIQLLCNDYGLMVPWKPHIANKFLVDWFAMHPPSGGLRLCSHVHCGRPESRMNEFKRCSVCGSGYYCSKACQALDWKLRHMSTCSNVTA